MSFELILPFLRPIAHFLKDDDVSEIMVRDQNEVLPCPFHEKPLGLLSEGKTLAEIFQGEAFQRLRRNMLRPGCDPHRVGFPEAERIDWTSRPGTAGTAVTIAHGFR